MTYEQLIQDKNYAPEDLGDVCVLGLGKTGNVVATYFCELLGSRVDSVHVYAGEKTEFAMRTADKLLKLGAKVSFDDKEINDDYNLCVASPGISEFDPLILSAKDNCDEVISEVEFAWRESYKDSKWVAVTGTNGKTTTTSMIAHMFNSAGKKALSVGNIGNVALSAVATNQMKSKYEYNEIYVAEVSSYQLALCDKFAPDVAVILNISPDHLNWHQNFENYIDAKFKVFNHADWAVINKDDAVVVENINKIKTQKIIKNFHDDNNICVTHQSIEHQIMPIKDLKLIGEHNCVNARAAASVGILFDLEDNQIADGLKTFKPLEHRLEPCGIVAGIRLFNDTKATNVDSVLVAIDAFPKQKAIFLLGGRDKNTDLEDLVSKASENLKGVVCFGEAGKRFYDAFKDKIDTQKFDLLEAQNMGSAFKIAMEHAYPGDFVVLSPACSSFDEFKNFEERGKVFKALVDKCKR